jgi:glycosyltransferase involved in cell wall biosynthesis
MNISNNKVSIIINTHNGAHFIKNCLISCLSQTHQNIEIIVFDNCSNDETEKNVKEFKTNSIKYIKSKKILNLYDARNLALTYVTGEFFCFLDVDDEYLKDKIQCHLEYHEKNECLISYSNLYLVKNFNKKKIHYKKNQKTGFIFKELLKKYDICFNSIIFSNKILTNIKFDSNLNILGDFELILNLSQKYKFHYINKPLSIYNNHEDNFSNKNQDLHYKEMRYWLIKKKNYKIKKKYKKIILEEYLFLKKKKIVGEYNIFNFIIFLFKEKKNKTLIKLIHYYFNRIFL